MKVVKREAKLARAEEVLPIAEELLPIEDVVTVEAGASPLILSIPHTGLYVPREVFADFSDVGRRLADTDWNVHRLYQNLLPDVTLVRAGFHRYLIDANRDPGGISLYPGQNTTGLCPLIDFDEAPLYLPGREPGPDQTESRIQHYHRVYHRALQQQIERLRQVHPSVLVYDCHSIRSEVPFLFSGRLADLNLGTYNGQTCAPELEAMAVSVCESASEFSTILNGRFKGGWTTRHYGQPRHGVHAIQMELAQSTYMNDALADTAAEPNNGYDESRAGEIRPVLRNLLLSLLDQLQHLNSN